MTVSSIALALRELYSTRCLPESPSSSHGGSDSAQGSRGSGGGMSGSAVAGVSISAAVVVLIILILLVLWFCFREKFLFACCCDYEEGEEDDGGGNRRTVRKWCFKRPLSKPKTHNDLLIEKMRAEASTAAGMQMFDMDALNDTEFPDFDAEKTAAPERTGEQQCEFFLGPKKTPDPGFSGRGDKIEPVEAAENPENFFIPQEGGGGHQEGGGRIHRKSEWARVPRKTKTSRGTSSLPTAMEKIAAAKEGKTTRITVDIFLRGDGKSGYRVDSVDRGTTNEKEIKGLRKYAKVEALLEKHRGAVTQKGRGVRCVELNNIDECDIRSLLINSSSYLTRHVVNYMPIETVYSVVKIKSSSDEEVDQDGAHIPGGPEV